MLSKAARELSPTHTWSGTGAAAAPSVLSQNQRPESIGAVQDDVGNVIETHQHKGDFKEPQHFGVSIRDQVGHSLGYQQIDYRAWNGHRSANVAACQRAR